MGFFGGGFTKEGPGVDKNAPKKKGIFLYIEIFIRKFWKIVQLNLLYTLFSIPMLVLLYFLAPVSTDFTARIVQSSGLDASAEAALQAGFRVMFALGILSLWGSGPASAGTAYIMRCFAREEHAWIWSDFWDKFKSNFKQASIVIIVDIVVLMLEINAMMFYFSIFKNTNDTMWLIITYMSFLLFVLYTFIHFYIYQIMVTFECTMVQLYRNALIFAFAKLPMNLLLMFFVCGFIFGLSLIVSPGVVIMLYATVGIIFSSFPIAFYASRSILKTLEKTLQNKPDKREERG